MPTRQIETKFFEFVQGNPGGKFKVDHKSGVGHVVIIEAIDADHAVSIAKVKISSWGDRHEFSGDRWDPPFDPGSDVPEVYGDTLQEFMTDNYFSDKVAYVHYFDGTIGYFPGSKYNP